MGKRISEEEIKSKKYGKLTAIELVGRDRNGVFLWRCMCDCGKECIVRQNELRNGGTKSCGCLRKESARMRRPYHHDERLYVLWIGIRQRCENPKHASYKWYGGKGIKVCDEWESDYMSFKKWALESGYDESLPRGTQTIDRIDCDGDYSPENCRWATQKEQVRNSSKCTTFVDYNGEKILLSELCERVGADYNKIRHRIYRGKTINEALDTSFDKKVMNRYFAEDIDGKKKSLFQFSKDRKIPYNTIKRWNKEGRNLLEKAKEYEERRKT